jgi:hypothetical protein
VSVVSRKRNENKKLHQRKRAVARLASIASRQPGPTQVWPPLPVVPREPSVLDQMGAYIDEFEIGRPETTLSQLREMAARLPFEPTMFRVAWLLTRLETVLSRPDGHWALAMEFYAGRPELLSAFAQRMRVEAKRAIFSPQALVLLMQILLEHAYDEPLRDATGAEAVLMQDAVLGAHSAVESGFEPSGPPSREEVLAFELQSATFFHRPDWLEEIARHQELLRLATIDDRLTGSVNRVPVDSWLAAAGLTADEQCTLGLGLCAMTRAVEDDVKTVVLAEHVDDFLARMLPAARDLRIIAASREELRAAIDALDGGDATLGWELRPFKSTPFLRRADGGLLLLSQSLLLSWLGEGFHYRALTHAQGEGPRVSARYTRFAGEVVERYALDLTQAAVTAPARVVGATPYGRGAGSATTDVTVVDGEDLVLFEVHARRVSAGAAVAGEPETAATEVFKLIVTKIGQLGVCIGALLSGRAKLPDVDITAIKRIWPVVVSGSYLMQTPNLWGYIRDAQDPTKTASLNDKRVQPLQVLSIEDFEVLLGLVEAGEKLPVMLARKTHGPFRERDLKAWLHGDKRAPAAKCRMSVINQRWQEIGDRLVFVTRAADEAAREASSVSAD